MIDMNDELFFQLTQYANQSDNHGDNLRRAKMLGFTGQNVRIAPGAIVRTESEKVGNNVFIGLYTFINGDVTICDNVMIGPHCSLPAGNHKFDPVSGWFSSRTESDGDDSIVIGGGCWLSSGVTITAGVKLGKVNLVCANSVVTKSTADYCIMAGTPAKVIGTIDPQTGEYCWN